MVFCGLTICSAHGQCSGQWLVLVGISDCLIVAIWRRRFFLMMRSSTEQFADFFGWKNGSMCQENISSSKPAILSMTSRLGGSEAFSQDPMLEMKVEMEMDPLDIKSQRQEMEEYIVLEEDPEMYAMAGIELVPVPAAVPVQERIESTIRQAMCLLWGHCEFKNCSSQL